MWIMMIISYFLLSTFIILLLYIFSCSESTNSETGTISVYVNDNDPDETAVPDVQIILLPDSIVKETNENGFCNFKVDPGNYYVNADLCCLGPGFIHYHKAVTVQKVRTLKLNSQHVYVVIKIINSTK
jgi:hypothetical protein